jgi:hypothetical protein
LISHDLFGKSRYALPDHVSEERPCGIGRIATLLKRKAGPISAQAHYGPAHSGFTEPHQAAAISAYNGKAGHAP